MNLFYYWEGPHIPVISAGVSAAGKAFKVAPVNIAKFYDVTPFPLKRVRDKADYFRVKALYDYGGVYMDADTLFLKDCTPLLRTLQAKGNFFYGSPSVIQNGVMASIKGSPFFRALLWEYDSVLQDFDESRREGYLNFVVFRGQIKGNVRKFVYPENLFHGINGLNFFKELDDSKYSLLKSNRFATTYYLSSLPEKWKQAQVSDIPEGSFVRRALAEFSVNSGMEEL